MPQPIGGIHGGRVGERRPLATKPATQNGSNFELQPFACPFYIYDYQKYSECQRYGLRRVKDVKQHLSRKHMQPRFYCARCYQIFPMQGLRDSHIREGQCRVRVLQRLDGISEQQREMLTQHPSRGKTVTEQWFDVWDVIFPGVPRPRSAYLGNRLEYPMGMLRRFWDERGPGIVSSAVAGAVAVEGLDRVMVKHLARQVMATMLDRLEGEMVDSVDRFGGEVAMARTPATSLATAPDSIVARAEASSPSLSDTFQTPMVWDTEPQGPYLGHLLGLEAFPTDIEPIWPEDSDLQYSDYTTLNLAELH